MKHWTFWFALIVLICVLVVIVALGVKPREHHTRHRPIPMAMEIRHKGPIMGQTVLYTSGGTTMPGFVRSINADGTVNLTTLPGGSVVADVASVKYDPTLATNPCWQWSDDL